MVDYTRTTGTTGQMRMRDNGSLVEFALRSHSALSISQLPWTYSVDGVESSWKSFNFQAHTDWQTLGVLSVSKTQDVIFKIGYTNTSIGGPTELAANIYRTPPPEENPDPGGEPVVRLRGAIIQVGESQKLAVPYINVNGVWKQAQSWAKREGVWKETT